MAEKPEDLIPPTRWAAEEIVAADMMEHSNVPSAHLVNVVLRNLVESLFKETGGPVDMKISVTEVRPGDYDKNTFEEIPVFRTGWQFRIEGEKRRPGRQAVE